MYISDISRCHGNGTQIYPVVMETGYIQDISVIMATGVSYVPLLWQYAWVHFRNIPFLVNRCMTSSLYYIQFNKCICNLTSEYSFNCGFKIFFDLSDVVCTQVVYITYNMGNRDLPDIYAHALGPAALGLEHIYQANPSCPCYNLYIYAKQKHPRCKKSKAKLEAPESYLCKQLKSVNLVKAQAVC